MGSNAFSADPIFLACSSMNLCSTPQCSLAHKQQVTAHSSHPPLPGYNRGGECDDQAAERNGTGQVAASWF